MLLKILDDDVDGNILMLYQIKNEFHEFFYPVYVYLLVLEKPDRNTGLNNNSISRIFSLLPLGGSDGYMSDGDALNLKSSACINQYYPHHHQHQHLPNSPPSQSSIGKKRALKK